MPSTVCPVTFAIRRSSAVTALWVVALIGVTVVLLSRLPRDDPGALVAGLGLTFAAAGMGAEIAVAAARSKKHRAAPRLAALLATLATFLGGLLTVAATGADVQGLAGDGGVSLLVGVALLALGLTAMSAFLVWHLSSVVP